MAASAWINHVKKYAKENGIKFGDALKKAGPSYNKTSSSNMKKTGGTSKRRTSKRRTRRR